MFIPYVYDVFYLDLGSTNHCNLDIYTLSICVFYLDLGSTNHCNLDIYTLSIYDVFYLDSGSTKATEYECPIGFYCPEECKEPLPCPKVLR